MSQVSAAQVKELRERSGVGMSKCKEALEQANGDMEKAIEILRKAGIAGAVKKEGREAKEGAIFYKIGSDAVSLVEVNAETDFVVKNDKFQEFGLLMAEEVAKTKPASLEAFLQQKYSRDPALTIEGARALMVQLLGENIQIKRLKFIPKTENKSFGIYSHMGGKITCLVELSEPAFDDLAKEVAMHIAAYNPEYIKPENIPAALVEKEKEIAKSQIVGKPEFVIEKILVGKINAFYDMVCLIRQKFVRDNTISVGDHIKKLTQSSAKPVEVLSFTRWSIG